MLSIRFVTQLQVNLYQRLIQIDGKVVPYGDGAALSLGKSTAFVCVPGAVPPARIAADIAGGIRPEIEDGILRAQGQEVGRTQRIVVAAAGSEAARLMHVIVSSILEAQREECPTVRLSVYQLRDETDIAILSPASADSHFDLKLLCPDIQHCEPLAAYTNIWLPEFSFHMVASCVFALTLAVSAYCYAFSARWLPEALATDTLGVEPSAASSEDAQPPLNELRALVLAAESMHNPIIVQPEIEAIKTIWREHADNHGKLFFDYGQLTSVDTLTRHLNRERPSVLHFIGHGKRRLLFFVDHNDYEQVVSIPIKTVAEIVVGVKCVVLQCCLGAASAKQLHKAGVPFVVYYNHKLYEDVAVRFSQAFWSGLFGGHGVRLSFRRAKAAVQDDNYGLCAPKDEAVPDLAF
eukprot:m.78237 g.78237  ORF g.78237 m.78237 type:complete len:407 (+) comp8157_c0_seq1:184-1404(+)